MKILSIQSHVVYGHVGNSAAVFSMQRLGVEVWPIHTVQFSNHTGYGHWTGRIFDGASVDDLVDGVAHRGVLGSCDGVLSGYMGSPDVGAAILGAAGRVRSANRRALYGCDPVIGDRERGIFVRPGVPEFMRERAVPAADIIMPNHFELEYLVGGSITGLGDAKAALERAHALGPTIVLVTSLALEDTPADAVDVVASDASGAWRLRTPKLELAVNGAGDMIAALFLVHFVKTRSAAAALEAATSSVHGILVRTLAAGSRELALVAAQQELVTPSRRFSAEQI